MTEGKTLDAVAGRAGIWYTIGNILLKGCVFLALPIFTRLLSTSDFGIYNTYMAYEGIFTALLGLGLYGTVKNAKLDYKERFEEYLSSVLSLSLLVLAVALIVANVFFEFYSSLWGFSRFVTNCLLLQSFGAYLIYFYGAKLNIEFKYKSYIGISCFNTVGNILLSVILIRFVFPNERYLGRILGSAMPLILVAVLLCCTTIYRGRTFYNQKYWKYAITIGLPLVPHVVSQSLLSQFDRVMISNMVGDSEAGIYSYVYTICTITYVICQSLDNAWTPWVYMKLQAEKQVQVKKASKAYINCFALLTLGFVCIMPEITKLIADNAYWDGVDLIIPMALANYCIFLYMMPVNIEYYNRKTKYISIGTIAAAIVNLTLNYVAIRLFGYRAAAYTTLVSYLLLFIFHWIIAGKFCVKGVYSLKYIIRTTVILAMVSIIILFTGRLTIVNFVIRYIIVAAILCVMLRKRKWLVNLMKGTENKDGEG